MAGATVSCLGTVGVVREADHSGLVLVQLKVGQTAWAFASDVSRRKLKAARGGVPQPKRPPSGIDESAEPGLAVGTLRWAKEHMFPSLGEPTWASPPERLLGWAKYARARPIAPEPSLIDGLSYPLTLLFAWEQLARLAPMQLPALGAELTLVLCGASQKVEERLLYETSYWLELIRYPRVFPPPLRLKLLLAGREVRRHGEERVWSPRVRSACFCGGVSDALAAHGCEPATAVLVGYNTGCGSGIEDVMVGWAPDLRAALLRGFLGFFTCANDYSDLRGELALHELLGANVVLPASRSAFPAMVVTREPARTGADGREAVHWSRSSSFLYAVRGLTPAGAARAHAESASALQERVRALAQELRESEEVSPVP
ncbi:hypothetical protein KFE25_009579 [Diacronema lutheri]|uniref:Uncharacterized protein n=3 Tax=Diacronema lutheri TaxID=2081491 RepID=A0A8J6CKJ6_DIALT|nr:hypothetical protein KFE25_009579 [Diacronema lutheri]